MGEFVLDWKTKATGLSSEQVKAATAKDIPLGRSCSKADVVNAILFFLQDSSAFITGTALDVDGGMTSTAGVPGTG